MSIETYKLLTSRSNYDKVQANISSGQAREYNLEGVISLKSSREKRAREFEQRINEQYEDFEVIPSYADLGIDLTPEKELVGAYCRVSTMQEAQVDSFIMQKKYYEEYVEKKEHWELIDIYADEGISATSIKRRKDFLRMLDDCKAGRLTRIITKSVSRFGRNVVDTIATVRSLRNLPTPVGVYFETERIDTLKRESDMQLSLLASFAESESVTKSESVKWGIRNRFAKRMPRIVDLYGFDRDGLNLTINGEEGPIVAKMYELLFDGYSPAQIARYLNSMKVPTPRKIGDSWVPASVKYILANERNCGDVIIHKTVTIDIFSHKSVKNTGQERSYRLKNHHPGIISYEDWLYACVILKEMPFDKALLKDAPNLEIDGSKFTQINMSGARLVDADATEERK